MSRKRKQQQTTVAGKVDYPPDAAIVIHPAKMDGVESDEWRISQALGENGQNVEHTTVTVGSAAPFAMEPRESPSLEPVNAPVATGKRALSLDALRGAFLLIMTMGMTTQGRIFPAWMYHRQNPPPLHDFMPIAGLTWRDIAFPTFLFSMAAALPITFGRRVDKGTPGPGIMQGALQRGAMLFLFALLIGHSNPYWMGVGNTTTRLIALAGFALMFLVFTRRPARWSPEVYSRVKGAGWLALAAFFAFTPFLYGETFSLARRDEIIAELAFASVTGVAIWYFTRENLMARLGVLAAIMAVVLGSMGEGWIQAWWWDSPAPWLFTYDYFKLLIVVVPGTIAGDLLVRWMKTPEPDDGPAVAWGGQRLGMIALLGVIIAPILVVGIYNRWVGATFQIVASLVAAGMVLVHAPRTPGEKLVRQMFMWGAFWLLLGLLMEPFEGGMKKVPGTFSYYLTMTGNALFVLMSLVIVVDLMRKRRWLQPVIDVGQNPMLCYVLYIVFLGAVINLIPPLRNALTGTPWESLLRSVIIVIMVAAITRYFTRKRIFWRT